jgi:hypothetical protein
MTLRIPGRAAQQAVRWRMSTRGQLIASDAARPHRLCGVAGWLYVLVVSMTALGPFFGMARLHGGLTVAEGHIPGIALLPEWQAVKFASWCAFAGLEALGVAGGLGLAIGRRRSAVNGAVAALWIAGPVESLVLYLVIPWIAAGHLNFAGTYFISGFLGPVAASVAWAAGWSAYLVRSQRVRLTYASAVPASADAR